MLALGLGFLCHCALHIVGQYNVLNLDRRYLGAPRPRVPVDDVLDLQVDARGVREKLIEAVLHRDGAQRYAHHLLDWNEDEREARPPHALKFSEKKYHATL